MNLMENNGRPERRKPSWLRKKLPSASEYSYIHDHLKKNGLHTICRSGSCPNIGECWANRTATFMILGDVCTRNCRFCGVTTGKPQVTDEEEPLKLARVIREIGLKHCVITSVTRDDLPDHGANIWAETILQIKRLNPDTTVEALVPDFGGNEGFASIVFSAKHDILSHNVETIERLTPMIRSGASYRRSLKLLKQSSEAGLRTKSGIMLGLGEQPSDIETTLQDLLEAGCTIFTAGQYLQPGKANIPVEKYYSPEEFEIIRKRAVAMGFMIAECGPLVRSSYHSHEHLH